MSHNLDHWDRFMPRWSIAVVVPVVLLGASFGQRPAQEKAPLQFVNAFSADVDVNGNRTPCQHMRDIVHPSAAANGMGAERPAVCDSVLNIVAGKATVPSEAELPIRAGKIAVDSKQRVLITEPSTRVVHVLDFKHRKYLRINGAKGDRMISPFAVASDAANNIYVTDLELGRIAVYKPDGKFLKYIGTYKGEGLFEDPRAIAIDPAAGRIYLADTSRSFILILDLDGNILTQVGKRGGGDGPGEFRQPSDIAIHGGEVFVLDRQTFRIQVLDLKGNFRRQFQLAGAGTNAKGIAFDSQGRLFAPVPVMEWLAAFNQEGELLFRLGQRGDNQGEFKTPDAICTDSRDRVYVVDSENHRIQVFQITDHPKSN